MHLVTFRQAVSEKAGTGDHQLALLMAGDALIHKIESDDQLRCVFRNAIKRLALPFFSLSSIRPLLQRQKPSIAILRRFAGLFLLNGRATGAMRHYPLIASLFFRQLHACITGQSAFVGRHGPTGAGRRIKMRRKPTCSEWRLSG
jgi:hypothetical protein